MMLIFISVISLLAGAWIQAQAGRCLADRRLGRLGTGDVSSDEMRRAVRRAELGESGTYKVHNCGRILHVDYERGELIVEREVRRA
jgi:hypothetical protein